jgi:hypothetical protein
VTFVVVFRSCYPLNYYFLSKLHVSDGRSPFPIRTLPYSRTDQRYHGTMANQSHRPAKGRTELEEELHETAHIDYERVAIVRNPSQNSCNASISSIFKSPYLTAFHPRSPTRLLLLCTKMPSSMKQELPSHPPVLCQRTLEPRPVGHPWTRESFRSLHQKMKFGGDQLTSP